jgi:hypothetical protein
MARALLVAAAAAALGLGREEAASAQQTPPSTNAPAASPPASASPAPTPTPTASPYAYGTIGGAFTVYGFQTNGGTNATGALDTPTGADRQGRDDVGNMLVNASYTSGLYKASITGGGYSFLTVGQAINPTFQHAANTYLYTWVPLASAQYTSPDQHWTIVAGKLGTMLGAEGIFTYQNIDVERGLAWSMEPVISRGVHVGYTSGPWTFAVEANDGFYSGWGHVTPEYELAWSPNLSTSVTFVGINPPRNTPGNPTAAIANKSEYNLIYSHTMGRWQLSPYFLWVQSPASTKLGYTSAESAWAASLLATYTFSPLYSLGFRVEDVSNTSATSDTGPNADLIGYGPGSGAMTYTITPTYKFAGNGLLRLEFAHVTLRNFTGGFGFGPTGSDANQNRFGLEFGVTR